MKQYRFISVLFIVLSISVRAGAQKAPTTTYSQMMAGLASLKEADAATGQGRLELVNLGKSVKGKDIVMAVVADPEASREETKKLFVVCRQHGDEPAPTEAMLKLIRDLVLDNDPGAGEVLSQVSFYVVLMMNPDGADANKRRNANNVDLNRDWLNLSQPETRCVSDAIKSISPDVLIDQHEMSASSTRTDFVETVGPDSGAGEVIVARSEELLKVIIGMLRTHDMAVRTSKIEDRHEPRLAHRYFPLRADTDTFLFETKRSGIRQYMLQHRVKMHIVGTMTIAKYLAGEGENLRQRITASDAQRRAVQLASRGKPPVKKESSEEGK